MGVAILDTTCTPAVDHDGLVAGPPLHLPHLLNHVRHSLEVRTAAIRAPVGDVEQGHLMSLVSLGGGGNRESKRATTDSFYLVYMYHCGG